MADEIKRTSVEWMGIEPYNNVMIDSFDGWGIEVKTEDKQSGKTTVKTVRDLNTSFNTELITEEVFRTRLKNSNVRVPAKKAADFEKAQN